MTLPADVNILLEDWFLAFLEVICVEVGERKVGVTNHTFIVTVAVDVHKSWDKVGC